MIVLLPSLIMLVSALQFFKKRSNNDKLPAKYGRYQRNVFTFKQSFFYNLYCQFIYFTTLFVIVIFSYFSLPPKLLLYFLQIYFAIFYSFLPGFLLPIILIWKLRINLPELFSPPPSKTSKIKSNFYVRHFEILPQRDFEGEKRMETHKNDTVYIIVEPFHT